ncbi:MAG: ABC transporter permease [Shimia sp.]|nr:ABC transporter permease [Shimia sp.]MCP4827077.1 ABC transporter permease [Shimia sp.]|mmetsp:Transcript_7056/g.11450  ORF Transcript_7056/g.11450 Transcript_7056/m.11450 type:complete len:416 (+) Transcript_7056:109-1356(+)
MLLRLAFKSLKSRLLTVSLTVFAIALSVALFLGVEKVRTGAKASFADTISGTDLIVGARSGGVQLLLYSVFRVGNATNNVTWQSYQDIAVHKDVDWIVPLSLGDSHKGFRVLGTTTAFFDRYKYRGGRDVTFTEGRVFDDLFDAVVGADVAAELDYAPDDEIVVAHGVASFTEHDDKPFKISGVLQKTGTPVDRTVFVSLEAIEAIHIDWQGGGRSQNTISADEVRQMELTPKAVTAALVGVSSRLKIFGVQRWVNDYPEEPLLAILPGVALSELWSLIGVAETALVGVSVMVMVTALLGMVAMIFSGLNERRREMALLRAIGARPRTILGLLTLEAALMSLVAVLLGVALLYTGLFVARSYIDAAFGLYLEITWPTTREYLVLATVVAAGTLVSLIPALRAYFMSLADGMQVRN